MDNDSSYADGRFKGFLIVLSIFIGIYYITLLICYFCKVKYVLIFVICITIGIAVSMALSGILYGIRMSDPENKMTFQLAVEKTILVGLYFGITCGLLYILSKTYGYNLELLILSAILLGGILASVGTGIPWQSLVGIAIIIIYPPFKLLCQAIYQWLQKKRNNENTSQNQKQNTGNKSTIERGSNGNIELTELPSSESESVEV